MDLYQNLRMLDIPGFRQFAGFSPAPCRRLPIPPSNTSILSFQSSRIPMSASSLFLFLTYLSLRYRQFLFEQTSQPSFTQPAAIFDTPMTAVTDLDGIIKKLSVNVIPTVFSASSTRQKSGWHGKRQISITWRKSGDADRVLLLLPPLLICH